MQNSSGRKHYLALALLALTHGCITLIYALTRLYTYKASLLDIGLFDQLLWNLQHTGAPLTTATLPFTAQHWLGFHFSPLLFALLPLYAVWPAPELFQVIQSLCFGAAGIPLFLAMRAMGVRVAEAWGFTLLYWFNPMVLSAAIWDFHEIALSTLIIALALYALAARRFMYMLAALGLLLATKEHYGVTVAGFGVLWGWHHRDWKRGGLLVMAGLATAACILKIVMPYFSGAAHPMFSNEGSVVSRYGWLRLPLPQMLERLMAIFFGDGTPYITGAQHLVLLLLSGGLLPLLSPFYLAPMAADLVANLLSANPMPRHIASYHAAACIPVIMLAAAHTFDQLRQRWPQRQALITGATLAIIAVLPGTGLTFMPFSVWELRQPVLHKDITAIGEIAVITADSPLSAQANVGMFFSQRANIFPFPHRQEHAQFVVLRLQHPFASLEKNNFNIPYGVETTDFVQEARRIVARQDWKVVYWNRPWLVLERGTRNDADARYAEINAALDVMRPQALSGLQNP